MELIENLLQLLVTFVGALLSGISYRKSHRQAYFLLLCFYGCFALGALYWTLYLLWTAGCFWPDTSPASPTFWCDILLTLVIPGLLPATRKAVDA